MRYYPENTCNPVVAERIVAGVGRSLKSHVKGKMNFEDFVWFCLCEEHKGHHRAIAYWFRVLDVDQDGIISGYELEQFYQHTKEKMRLLTTEFIVFDDVMCQVSDMMSFSRRAIQPSESIFADEKEFSLQQQQQQQGSNNSDQKNNNKTSARAGRPTSALGNKDNNTTSTFSQQRPQSSMARPRSAAPSGSAARLMSAAPTSRPVVGTDPREEKRRLSFVGSSSQLEHQHENNGSASAEFDSGNNKNASGTSLPPTSPVTSGGGVANLQQPNTSSSSNMLNNNNSSSSTSFSQHQLSKSLEKARHHHDHNLLLRLHAGFTLSDFIRNPTAAHVAINMLTNVSKFLQFEQRDPFVAHERPNSNNNNHNNNTLQFEGMGNLLSQQNNILNPNNGPLEKTEWDRFCRAEYDRMAADDEAP